MKPEKIILTASGGPFRSKSKAELSEVSLKEALAHPNWSMGKKSYHRFGNHDEQRT